MLLSGSGLLGTDLIVGVDPAATELLSNQVFYLVTTGSVGAHYHGPVMIEGISVPAFVAPAGLEGQEDAILESMLSVLSGAYPASKVTFTTDRPEAGDYSTVYIGGNGEPFSAWGNYYGVAEQVDAGNQDRNDSAFVFPGMIDAGGLTARAYGQLLAEVVAHEAGHLLGEAHHDDHDEHSDEPLADVAFDPKVHVSVGDDAVVDVLDDGMVTIAGEEYAVHPKIVAALRDHRAFYNAGVVGPDGFPDSIMGQFVLHAEDHAVWLTRMLDMAWQAQSDPTFTDVEKSQILAFAYGYLTHSTGDLWAHTLVNEFTEGVAPGFINAAISAPTDQRDLGNMIRHFMTEAYIADALEGVDSNPDRTVLSGGDVSDDSTPGIAYDAPVRFIYEALIRAFPGDPTPLIETEHGQIAAVGNTFVRTFGSFDTIAGPLGDGFKIGHKITVTGSGANNGEYLITDVTPLTLTVDRALVPEAPNSEMKIVVHDR